MKTSFDLAAGYQHFADGATFGEIALAHPAVREVYFPWPDEPSGRPVLGYEEENDPQELQDALRYDLTRLRAGGVKLDLLLNANCYGADAMSVALERRVGTILDTLADWSCAPEIVTTASPFVARCVKAKAPRIEVRASVNMRLSTLQAMAYLAPLFDSFYLGRDVQRDRAYVEKAHAWCAAHGKKLCLLANSGCLRNCPWQTFHDNLVAHSAAALARENVRGWSPHLCWTIYKDAFEAARKAGAATPPAAAAEILKATWIRPEDLARYAGLVDVVKLATRQHANPEMVIAAYARGSFDGNLLDLLEPGFSPVFHPFYLDNASFPADWMDRVAGCSRECTQCGYCEQVLGKVCKTIGL